MVSPETAVRSIRSGERVFVGTGCGEPRGLVRALEALHPGPDDVELVSVFPTGRFDSTLMSARRHRNRVFVGGGGHDAAGLAMIDYVAIGLDEVPALLAQGRLPVDVAMVQVSVPDAHGYASLGISVDLAPAALRAAKRIIAEVNPAMPRTHGDSLIHLDRIDVLTETECPLGEFAHPPGKEIAVNIAAYVAAIIEDGSTLQIGMGALPDQVLRLLGDRRHLSIHTDLLTDGVIDLIQSGAVTGRRKDLFRERIVASYCLGTQRLYDFVDDNPLFCFLPIEQVCAPENSRAHWSAGVSHTGRSDRSRRSGVRQLPRLDRGWAVHAGGVPPRGGALSGWQTHHLPADDGRRRSLAYQAGAGRRCGRNRARGRALRRY